VHKRNGETIKRMNICRLLLRYSFHLEMCCLRIESQPTLTDSIPGCSLESVEKRVGDAEVVLDASESKYFCDYTSILLYVGRIAAQSHSPNQCFDVDLPCRARRHPLKYWQANKQLSKNFY